MGSQVAALISVVVCRRMHTMINPGEMLVSVMSDPAFMAGKSG